MKTPRLLQELALTFSAAVLAVSCTGNANPSTPAGNNEFMEMPGYGNALWVTDADIQDTDLDYLADLGVKLEFMRLEMIRMLSNNFEGDRLFCGTGDKSNADPTVACFTRLMTHEQEYQEAIERLGSTSLMTPTTKMDLGLSKLKAIFTAGWEEGKRAQEEIQDNLMHLGKGYDQTAQQQLYDFYVEMEPENARQIGATDARDFFLKLNSGELNAYTVNIGHIWRDVGKLKAGDTDSRVGDYAVTADKGDISYLQAAYRVSSKVAVNLGEYYLSSIDNMAGGYGSKIIELGEALQTKLKALELTAKALTGKPDWQGMNTYLVNAIMGDVKEAVGNALGGDNANFGQEFIKETAEILADKIVEMATEQKSDSASDNLERTQTEEGVKEDGLAILEIYTDPGTLTSKLAIITDDRTGAVSMARPNADGHLCVVTTPGGKTITVVRSDGKRMTKHITAKEGYNTIQLYYTRVPFVDTNYEKVFLGYADTYATGSVLTNCRYVKIHYPNKPYWFDVSLERYSEDSMWFVVKAKVNDTGLERYATFELQGFEERSLLGAPLAKCTVTVRQYAVPQATGGSISTSSLQFDAAGGTQSVTLTPGSYAYFGCTVRPEYKDWISADLKDSPVIDITVKPNTLGQPREGVVECFLTNEESPTEQDKVLFPVTVKQDGSVGGGMIKGLYVAVSLADAAYTYSSYRNGSHPQTGSLSSNTYEAVKGTVSVQSIAGGLVLSVHHQHTEEYTYDGGPIVGTFTRDETITLKAGNANDPQTYVIQSAEAVWKTDEADKDDAYYTNHFIWTGSFSGASISLSGKSKTYYEYVLKGDAVPSDLAVSIQLESQGYAGSDGVVPWDKTLLNSWSPHANNVITVRLYTE